MAVGAGARDQRSSSAMMSSGRIGMVLLADGSMGARRRAGGGGGVDGRRGERGDPELVLVLMQLGRSRAAPHSSAVVRASQLTVEVDRNARTGGAVIE